MMPTDPDQAEWLRICAKLEATPLPESKHRCPWYCHRCPDLVAITLARGGDVTDSMETTMPGACSSGWQYGLDACTCRSPARTAERRREEVRQLEKLIRAYPADARRILDAR